MKRRGILNRTSIVGILCALFLVVGFTTGAAAATDEVASGTCGADLTWVLTSDGTLTISGTGEMTDYSAANGTPWSDYIAQITRVVLKEGVTAIGSYAFYNCSSMEYLVLPESLTAIHDYPSSSKSLTDIFYLGDSQDSIAFSRWAGWMETGAYWHFVDSADVIVPLSWERKNGTLSFFSVSNDNEAAYVTPGETLELPRPREYIGYYFDTFAVNHGTVNDTAVVISSELSGSDPVVIEARFEPNYPDKTIIARDYVGTSPSDAWCLYDDGFLDVRSTSGGYYSRDSWDDIKTQIKSAYIHDSTYSLPSFAGCTNLERVTLPDNLRSLPSFLGCTSLKSLVVPDSVTTIPGSSLAGCTALEELTVPFIGYSRKGHQSSTSNTYDYYPLGWFFGRGKYDGCSFVSQYYLTVNKSTGAAETNGYGYYIPDSLKKVTVTDADLHYGVFYNCKKLTDVEMGSGVTEIGEDAFYNCDGLKNIVIGDGVTSIDDKAFDECDHIETVVVGKSVASIGAFAFNTPKLTSVYLPRSLERIGSYAFRNCPGLRDVYYSGSEEQWKTIDIAKHDDSNKYLLQATMHYDHKILRELVVTTPPDKTDYIHGEVFDKTGLVITAVYDDDSTADVTEACQIRYENDGDYLSKGDSKVTVSYGNGTIQITGLTVASSPLAIVGCAGQSVHITTDCPVESTLLVGCYDNGRLTGITLRTVAAGLNVQQISLEGTGTTVQAFLLDTSFKPLCGKAMSPAI